eukprot:10751632-Ditylum_brightwellii.AAC.1
MGTGWAEHVICKTTVRMTLCDTLTDEPASWTWATFTANYDDEGNYIAEAIENGCAIAVSDGHSKKKKVQQHVLSKQRSTTTQDHSDSHNTRIS